ncbi:PC-esterase domain-containing protein 1A isoform X2 [Mugil cephalus]|uniref:PC-esterase domain-containing protein 1A isoform X2 n=1 Tax=Mugil cephalus TaxID=48193 RepID=UPI001FB81D1A|nr:PC-esterase domain-containing protein 1A isoform X2 [Mugil cephalus]
MKETMKCVSHKQASQLLHNKFIVVLGDSIHRAIYKDLVLLIQQDKYLSMKQLKTKGEISFEQDCLVEGGCLDHMHNGTEYREVRQFQSSHHLVRFYFVTRIYSRYMRSVIADLRRGLKPDAVIVNSCVWDISRYNSKWLHSYKENLHEFFDDLKTVLPEETLVIWNLTMPLAENIKGGFLVPEIEHKAPQLRYDVIEANFYSGTLADAYGMDVLDLHFLFRFSLHHRTKDGVHWNAIAHRMISSLLLQHAAQAWGVILTRPTAIDWHPTLNSYDGNREEFSSDQLPSDYLSFEESHPEPRRSRRRAPRPYRPPSPPRPLLPDYGRPYEHHRHDYDYRPPQYYSPYREHHHQYVMRSRHVRHHYAPYPHHRPIHHGYHNYYY